MLMFMLKKVMKNNSKNADDRKTCLEHDFQMIVRILV